MAESGTLLEVYPEHGVARVTTNIARLEVHGLPGYAVDADRKRVVFEHEAAGSRSRLIVSGEGKISYHPVIRAANAPPHTSPETTTATQKPAPGGGKETSETALVTLQGRLGRDPWFSTRDDLPIAGFPLAVNTQEKALWHNVVVFDETLETLRDQAKRGEIRKGRLVDVTGQEAMYEYQTDKGTKHAKEFRATAVTRVRGTKPQS